jgi:chemotaxis signal transduction protein
MSNPGSTPSSRSDALRLAFDRGFATLPLLGMASTANLLAITVEASLYALRSSEITGIFSDKKITRVPSSEPALLGIASFRGAIMPVYDLHALLGFPAAATTRWLVTAAAAPIALAFSTLEGHLQIAPDALVPQGTGADARSHVHEFIHEAGAIRAVIDLDSVIAAVRARMSRAIA